MKLTVSRKCIDCTTFTEATITNLNENLNRKQHLDRATYGDLPPNQPLEAHVVMDYCVTCGHRHGDGGHRQSLVYFNLVTLDLKRGGPPAHWHESGLTGTTLSPWQ